MKIFISKAEDQSASLKEWCEAKGFSLHAESLIETAPIPFTPPPNYEVIFFSSKNAIDYFVDRHGIDPQAQIGAAGPATATLLEQKGFTVDFIPTESGKPNQGAKELSAFVGARSIYFPGARLSAGTYSQPFINGQKIIQDIYDTRQRPVEIPKCDIYVFSSPSNLNSFLSANKLRSEDHLIAWGKTTARSMEQHHLQASHILDHAGFPALLRYLDEQF